MRASIILFCILIPTYAFANHAVGIGDIAKNLIEPVNIVSDFIASASFIVGASCIFAGFLRFMQYRVNPMMAPISTVMTLFILGIVLILLPFIYLLTESGIRFSFF